jgi:AcrR family transcriptional regulator
MVTQVNGSRPYRSPLRESQGAATRRRVLDAARDLFVERGYTSTTVAEIAAAADVSPQTIYKSLGGKSGLLEAIIDDSHPGGVPYEEQTWWVEIAALPSAAERLQAYVAACCGVLARTRPIHAVIRGALGSEAFVGELRTRLFQTRLERNTAHLRTYIGDDLRPGLTLREAAQRYFAIASPELYDLMTQQLGWSVAHHQRWLTETAARDLLGHT